MRRFRFGVGMTLMILAVSSTARAAANLVDGIDTKALDRQLYDSLRDVHNRGADLYNAGEPAACYRMFQGALQVTRAALAHRPAEQKLIADGLATAERETSISRRAYQLHELIEQVRSNIRPEGVKADAAKNGAKPPVVPQQYEPLPVVPRELPAEKAPAPKKTTARPTKGVAGRVLFENKPLPNADVAFVSRGQPELRVHETTTDRDGSYAIESVTPGRYTVLLTTNKESTVKALPARYATTDMSPLIVDVKPGGETLDFILQ